jgi:hypothetical protein
VALVIHHLEAKYFAVHQPGQGSPLNEMAAAL